MVTLLSPYYSFPETNLCGSILFMIALFWHIVLEWLNNITDDLSENHRVRLNFSVFIIASLIVGLLAWRFPFDGLGEGILVESFGMLCDLLIITVFLFWLHERGDRKREIQRYKDEIDDFRRWESNEAAYRIVGNVKRLIRANETKIDIQGCFLQGVFLTDLSLIGAKLRDAKIEQSKLYHLDLSDSNLYGVKASGSEFDTVALKNANLESGNFTNASFTRVDFQGANFRWVILNNTDFMGCNFDGANFEMAKLQNANLSDTVGLRDTNFRKANLSGAMFGEWAKLDNADFTEANLENTYFGDGTDLTKTKGLTKEQISVARISDETKLPDYLK